MYANGMSIWLENIDVKGWESPFRTSPFANRCAMNPGARLLASLSITTIKSPTMDRIFLWCNPFHVRDWPLEPPPRVRPSRLLHDRAGCLDGLEVSAIGNDRGQRRRRCRGL